MMPSSRTVKGSIRSAAIALLILFYGGIFLGCSTFGRNRLLPESGEKMAGTSTESLSAVQVMPTNSQSNNGFDSERLWGPYNDWEPAIAIDPISGNVYQLTTRYDGPEPCKRCAGPYIIFRRSVDGGATLGRRPVSDAVPQIAQRSPRSRSHATERFTPPG